MAKANSLENVVVRALRDQITTAELVALLGDLEGAARARAAQLRNCASSDAALLGAYAEWQAARSERAALELAALLLVRARAAEQRCARAARAAARAAQAQQQQQQQQQQRVRDALRLAMAMATLAIAIAIAMALL